MAEDTLVAVPRQIGVKSSVKKLRAENMIPAVLYGSSIGSRPVAVDAKALRHFLGTARGQNALITLSLEGVNQLVMAREIQRDPIKHSILHVDFLAIDAAQPIVSEVPIVLTGEAPDLKKHDGRVEQLLFKVHVRSLPTNIPDSLELDITGLTIGDHRKIGDIRHVKEVEIEMDPEVIVVVGQPPRVIRVQQEETEAGQESQESTE
jgi:large subunit ribosomal protein L25